jgi:tetratricopeptide (TPR) repeat protein
MDRRKNMMKIFSNMRANLLVCLVLLVSSTAWADEPFDTDLAAVQHSWAKIRYGMDEKAQEPAFKNLVEEAHQFSEKYHSQPEALIWEGIINASYAKAKGGIGALKFAEKARDLLLAAEKANPEALQGAAYTSLGSLFYKVPGWPIGFGDKKKAQAYLEKALKISPNGIDSNFFYADFLSDRGDYAKAVEFYKKALAAPPRAGREDADAGRRAEAEAGLKFAQSKI